MNRDVFGVGGGGVRIVKGGVWKDRFVMCWNCFIWFCVGKKMIFV